MHVCHIAALCLLTTTGWVLPGIPVCNVHTEYINEIILHLIESPILYPLSSHHVGHCFSPFNSKSQSIFKESTGVHILSINFYVLTSL